MNAHQTVREESQESRDLEARAPLSQIAEMIRLADARSGANEELRERNRIRLAATLGCSAEDLQEIVDSFGAEYWEQLVFERRIQLGIDSSVSRDMSWDRLEAAVLRKLIHLVDENRVSAVGELIAIARTANQATRRTVNQTPNPLGGGGQGMTTKLDIDFSPGDPANGILPSGNLGKISLTLSHRVKEQLESQRTIEGERVLDSVDMLDLKDIQAAGDSDG